MSSIREPVENFPEETRIISKLVLNLLLEFSEHLAFFFKIFLKFIVISLILNLFAIKIAIICN